MAPTNIPIIGFSAWSGTGKTTLLEQLIRYYKGKGLRLAVLKHDAHEFEIDHEGKDSWRFTQAGADLTLISSATKTALVEQGEHSFEQNLAFIHDVDLILVEGYKRQPIPRVGICRKATGKGLPDRPETYLAIATDDESLDTGAVPTFPLDDISALGEHLLAALHIDFAAK